MTGHGWRCPRCTVQSEVAIAQGGGRGMGEHLTPAELRDVVTAGTREALVGTALAIGGLLGTWLTLSVGGRITVLCGAAFIGGIGTAGHGLHRRRQALAALRQVPTAQVVKR